MMRVGLWLRDLLLKYLPAPAPTPATIRARPGQQFEANQYIYAPGGVSDETLLYFIMNEWVYTAVSRLAEMASQSKLFVVGKDNPTNIVSDHPLLDLLGWFGQPNDAQDSIEFFEQAFQYYDLAGNVYMHWVSRGGGSPQEVYLLDPTLVRVIPGSTRTIGGYEYTMQGHTFKLLPQEITHIRRASPYSIYYGMSAMEALRLLIRGDRAMLKWNTDFFDVAQPAGILVIDSDVGDKQRETIEAELNASHAKRRRVAVVRAKTGAAVWNDAGLKPHEMDFVKGRLINRQAVFDSLGMHTGLLSEASTEAHARVAERRVLHTVWGRQVRITSRLNNVLTMWPNSQNLAAQFEDVRVVDWQQEEMKLRAVAPFMTKNEVRGKYLNLPPSDELDMEERRRRLTGDANNAVDENEGQPDARGRNDTVRAGSG